MEIREFAEQVLFSTNLDEKLRSPSSLTDERAGTAIEAPRYPGRPEALRIDRPARKKEKFPSVSGLEKAETRGKILHFFTNHELMAAELMALLLLKFPEAPRAFRMSIARTIIDEQKHVRLYKERVEAAGFEFGDFGVNQFFWKALSGIGSPMDYVTWLSLTFEQANLDFALYYKNLFGKIGDEKTAQALTIIYEDEINHVENGLRWFNEWKEPELDDWEAYQKHLPPTLSPVRAKGPIFDKKARQKIGFSQHFIEELELYSYSKGRPPVVYLFNASGEMLSNIRSEQDFQILPMFLAKREDVVLMEYPPTHTHRFYLKNLGFILPQFEHFSPDEGFQEHPLRKRKLGPITPTRWTPQKIEEFAPLLEKTYFHQNPESLWNDAIQHLHSTDFRLDLLRQHLEQHQATDLIALDEMMTIETKGHPLLSYDIHFEFLENGHFAPKDTTLLLFDEHGEIKSFFIGDWMRKLNPELLRFLYRETREGNRLEEILREMKQTLAPELQNAAYHGPISLRIEVHRDSLGQLRIHPFRHFAPYLTLSRMIAALKKRLQKGRIARFLIWNDTQITPFDSLEDLANALREYWPIETLGTRSPQMSKGILLLNDPQNVEKQLLTLVVARDFEEIERRLEPFSSLMEKAHVQR